MYTKPIFIFSLPRSGSTLLQRYLAVHPDIASVSEPWILLPHLFHLKEEGTLAQYGHKTLQIALSDFIGKLPGGENDYFEAMRDFILLLYTKVAGEKPYFLDKTPRYYLIIPYIKKVFPDAKFIFLFRNPLAVIASIMRTWSNGNFRNLYRFNIDLYRGPQMLVEGYKSTETSAIRVQYEDLVLKPEESFSRIFSYLGIDKMPDLDNPATGTVVQGKMGDRQGARNYSRIDPGSLAKWKEVFSTKYRISLAVRYLEAIGGDLLEEMGYPLLSLKEALESIPLEDHIFVKDRIDYLYTRLRAQVAALLTRENLRNFLTGKPVFPYS